MYRRELSYINVWLCMLVIFIHVTSSCIGAYGTKSGLYVPARLSLFVVQGFLFLSALRTFYWYRDTKMNYPRYYLSRITRIILPYAVVTLLFYLFLMWIGWIDRFSLSDLLSYFIHGDIAAPFYFIIIITQMYLLMPFWNWMVRRIPPVISLTGSLILTLLYKEILAPIYNNCPLSQHLYTGNVFLCFLIFWTAGCYAGQYYEKWIALLKRNDLIILMFLILGALAFLDVSRMKSGMTHGVETLHVFYCLAAIWGVSLICLMVEEFRHPYGDSINTGPLSWLTSAIDEASFEIYLIHCLVLDILAVKVLPKIGLTEPKEQLPFLFVGVYGISIAVSICWVKITKKR